MRRSSRVRAVEMPTVAQLEKYLRHERRRIHYHYTLSTTISAILSVAAAACLIAMLWLPVLRVYGGSMAPTLNSGEVIVSVKTSQVEEGDIVAFYCNNKLLVKRIIAGPGDVVDIDANGGVSVNGTLLDEPYVEKLARGECDVEFPCRVPDNKYFVLGDHRETSVDSRSSSVGFVSADDIVGRCAAKVWPLDNFGLIQ